MTHFLKRHVMADAVKVTSNTTSASASASPNTPAS